MTLRIGRVPYLNAAMFYTTLTEQPSQYALVDAVPRELGRLAREGLIDAGPMAVADYFRQQDRFELLGDLGIAVHRDAQSVLLFSKFPRQQLDGRVICVTEDTSTSVMLLRVLLEERFHQRPKTYLQTNTPNGCDALLLIGDEALQARQATTQRLPFVTDLGAAWWEWTLLPFVFAMWVVRRDVPDRDKQQLMQTLQSSLADGMQQAPAIAARQAARLGIPAKSLEAYLANLTYIIGDAEHRGMQQFHRLLLEREML